MMALAAGALVAALWLPTTADEFDTPATQPAKPERRSDLFRKYAQIVGRHYAPYEDDFICVPNYDPRYPSSRGITLAEAQGKLTRTVERKNGIVVQSTAIKPDRAEAEALAMPLPRLAVGEYGWVRGGTVDRVLGPADMILKNIELIDRDALARAKERAKDRADNHDDDGDDRDRTSSYDEAERYRDEILGGDSSGPRTTRRTSGGNSGSSAEDIERRFRHRDALATLQGQSEFRLRVRLRGYATARVVEGGEWIGGDKQQGVQLAIIRTVPDPKIVAGTGRRAAAPKRIFEAIPLSALKLGLTEEQFAGLLRARGYEEKAFLEMAQAEVRKSVKDGPGKIVEALEARRKDAEAAPTPEDAAATQPAPPRDPDQTDSGVSRDATPATQPDKPRRWQDMTKGGAAEKKPDAAQTQPSGEPGEKQEKPKRWQDM